MTVYVDDMRRPATVGTVSGNWSHLMSDLPGQDGTAELVAFAQRLGLRPAWIQHPGTPIEHFDLIDSKRRQALRLGAVSIRYGHEGAALTKAKRQGIPFDLDAIRAANGDTEVQPSLFEESR